MNVYLQLERKKERKKERKSMYILRKREREKEKEKERACVRNISSYYPAYKQKKSLFAFKHEHTSKNAHKNDLFALI